MATKIGDLGEKLIIQWLQSKSYRILHHKWRCRWGEIDIIAEERMTSTLAFVEVKTRKSFNWDSDGLEAVSESKQQKISRSGALFIARNPQYADYYISFDVAAVRYKPASKINPLNKDSNCPQITNISDAEAVYEGYYLELVNYVENAFELS